MKNFDAFFKEQENKEIEFMLFGKKETLPASLPAVLILKLSRAYKQYGENNLPTHVNLDMAFGIFGEKRVEKWCDKGLDVHQLEELIKWAMEEYGYDSSSKKKTVTKAKPKK